jgi:hypothetical protein
MRKPISQRRLKNDLKAFDNYFLSNQSTYKKMNTSQELANEYADNVEKFPPVKLRSERTDAFVAGFKAHEKSIPLTEIKRLCDIILNSPPDTPIKGEIESLAYTIGHCQEILNHF